MWPSPLSNALAAKDLSLPVELLAGPEKATTAAGYSHRTTRSAHLEQLGFSKLHFTLERAHVTQDFRFCDSGFELDFIHRRWCRSRKSPAQKVVRTCVIGIDFLGVSLLR